MSIERCDRHDEEFDTDYRSECVHCEQEAAELHDAHDDWASKNERENYK